MPNPNHQLAAIMFTDIVGYTAVMGKDSGKAMDIIHQGKDIQKQLVEKYNGRWLKEIGDGAIVQFSTALDSVNCAVEIQRASCTYFKADIRIGIHLGDITIEENDVYGDGVNVAARLESIADPGGIYISESIEKAIRGQLDVQAKYLGASQLKNVDYDVRTYALQGVGLPMPVIQEEKKLRGHFLAELQRRGVIRAGITYIIISLLLFMLTNLDLLTTSFPGWFDTIFIAILAVGFLISLFMSWTYERNPNGIIKTTSPQSWQNPLKPSRRKPLTDNLLIAGLLVMVIIMYFYPQ